MPSFCFLSLLLFLPLFTVAETRWAPDAVLVIGNANISSDCTVRNSAIINGSSPGPTLRFKEGQHVWIRVYNNMEVNTTMHFHGLTQWMSPFADGTPQTSQWPIAPSSYFDYEFHLTTGSSGTYMYHTHFGIELVTAYGTFIVDECGSPPFYYDEDMSILFGDYFHASDSALMQGLLGAPFGWVGEPQSIAVNGDALGTCNAARSVCTDTCHHHVIEIEPGKTYRVRAIGITALTYLYIALEGHSNLTLIEADGSYLSPVSASHLRLHSGQRFSFLFTAKTESQLAALGGQRTFWARIQSRYRPIRDDGFFILSYKKSGVSSPNGTERAPANLNVTVPLPNEEVAWVDMKFKPLIGTQESMSQVEDSYPRPADVSRRIILRGQQVGSFAMGYRWNVNGVNYSETAPLVPYLVQAYSNPSTLKPNYELADQNGGYDPSTGTYPIKLNETIEIVFENIASTLLAVEAHPWHIHGIHPWLIAAGVGAFSEAALANAANSGYSPAAPHRRDTVVVLPGMGGSYQAAKIPLGTQSGWVMMRMKATNAGAWLAHCHIQPHAIMGMAVVFLVGTEDLPPLPSIYKKEFLTFHRNRVTMPQSYFKEIGAI